MLATGLILIGILSRFVFHFENFTPILAIALFAGIYLPKRLAIIVPLVLIAISDAFIGFHSLILFTWGSLALIAFLGVRAKSKKTFGNIAVNSLLSAFLFYVVTNFGVWLFYETYAKSLPGLVNCYIAAIPYFRNTLLSTALYTFVLCGSYELFAARIKNTRFATVL